MTDPRQALLDLIRSINDLHYIETYNRVEMPEAEYLAVLRKAQAHNAEVLGKIRQLLAEGLLRRYGIHARVEGSSFVVDRVDDPSRLPPPPEGSSTEPASAALDPGASAAAVLDRLELELGVIEKTGFVSYFLIVADFVRHGRSMGVSCVARGSAAG